MVRSTAVGAVLAAFIVVGTAYALSQPMWQNLIAEWFGGPQRTREAMAATEFHASA
jgi:hypothetical protein